MKKRTRVFTKIASVLGLAFAAATALEWSGYDVFDDAKGGNPVCAVDPACRKLTPGEIEMARGVFGNSIDYRKVKLFNRNFMLFLGSQGGISPNGHIYVGGRDNVAKDYAQTPELQELFMHEMVHVWQTQTGQNVRRKALVTLIKNKFNYGASYAYDLDRHKRYSSYNLEQQADIVEDYFVLRRIYSLNVTGMDMTKPRVYGNYFYETAKTSCQELLKYEEKIAQAIPLTPEPACVAFRPKVKPPKPR